MGFDNHQLHCCHLSKVNSKVALTEPDIKGFDGQLLSMHAYLLQHHQIKFIYSPYELAGF